MSRFEVLSRERVHDGWAKLDRLEIRTDSHDSMERYVVEVGDAAGVLLHNTAKDTLLFVRQLRPALDRHRDVWPLEIVAGKVDPGELPEETAIRETEEEAGYRLSRVEPIAEYYASTGILSELVSVYYGTISEESRVSEGGGDHTEDLEFVELSTQQAFLMLDGGQIRDAKTVVALLWLRNRLS